MWMGHFQDNLKAAHGLQRDDATLPNLYANWVSTKKEPGPTRIVYDHLADNIKDDWVLLKPALQHAFHNKAEEREFTSRRDAYQRSKDQSLREYRDQLISRMDKYRANLRQIPMEWEREAIQRFHLGLKNKFMDANILMHCSGDDATLEQEFNLIVNWENTLSHLRSQNDPQGATAAEPMAARITGIPTLDDKDPVTIAIWSDHRQPIPTDKPIEQMRNQLKQHRTEVLGLQTEMKDTNSKVEDINSDVREGSGRLQTTLEASHGMQPIW
jgi:hypothetical protein